MDTLAATGLIVVVVLLAAVVLYRAWRHVHEEQQQLLLFLVLERRGISRKRLEAAVGPQAVADAARRCKQCRDKEACRAWLECWGTAVRAPECVNAALLERVRDSGTRVSPPAT